MIRVRRSRLLGLTGSLLGLALFAAACGGAASAGGQNAPSVKIVSPANGARVSEPFTLRLTASAPLGDPSTGNDHVHIGFDGQSVDVERNLVFGQSCTVTNLTPGRHTIEASLRNADHSATGATATITVTVVGGTGSMANGQGSCGMTPSGSTGGVPGY